MPELPRFTVPYPSNLTVERKCILLFDYFNKKMTKTHSVDAKIIGGIHEVLLVVRQVKSFLFARPITSV